MFEVKVFCEDNKLSKLLWALDGQIVGQPTLTPVRGAVAKAGKVRSTQPLQGGTLAEQVVNLLGNRTSVTPAEIRNCVLSIGGKAGSYGHVILTLRRVGFLSGKGGKGGSFTVHNQGE